MSDEKILTSPTYKPGKIERLDYGEGDHDHCDVCETPVRTVVYLEAAPSFDMVTKEPLVPEYMRLCETCARRAAAVFDFKWEESE